MIKKNIVGLDFETDENEQGDCVLKLCALSEENNERVYELDTDEKLADFLIEITESEKTYVVYNASFDIEILMGLFLKAGFEFITSKKERTHKTMRVLAGAKIYQLETFVSYKNKIRCSNFIDLGNIIVGSNLKEIAENYTDLHKGEYEIAKENEADFKEYNLLDARITRLAYERISEELGDRYMTIGSGAFDIMLKENYEGDKRERLKKFYNNYGKLTIEDDKKFRHWYRGGFGWCSTDERWEGRIHSYDKKSAYPFECIGKDYPTLNDSVTVKGYKAPTKEYPFSFVHCIVTGQVKKNYCPVLPTKNIYGDSNKYIYDLDDTYLIQIYGEKSEYDFFLENMEIDEIIYIETICMKKAKENPLEKYMLKYYNIKEESDGVRRDTAKRLINALTGKLGSNSIVHKVSYKLEDDLLMRDDWEEDEGRTYATQVVAVITSRVRCELYAIDSQLRDKCRFRLYATDSVKHSTEVQVIKQGSGKIGDWKLEKEDVGFIYLGLKAYMFDPYNEKNQKDVVLAGISRDKKQLILPNQFYEGNEVETKVSQRRRNGRVIYETKKHISVSVKKLRRREDD